VDELDIDLMPGHLIMLRDDDGDGTLTLGIWELRALVQHQTHTGTVPISAFPPVNTHTIDASMVPNPTFRLSCHLSPLYGDSSRLWILISTSESTSDPPHTLFLKYYITHSKGRAISIHSKSQWEHAGLAFPLPPDSCEISYAGNVETYWAGQHFFSLAGDEPCNKTLDLADRGDYTHLSPYSGTLTYCTEEEVIINYYE